MYCGQLKGKFGKDPQTCASELQTGGLTFTGLLELSVMIEHHNLKGISELMKDS